MNDLHTSKQQTATTSKKKTNQAQLKHRNQHPFDLVGGDKIAKCFAANNNNNRHQYAISVIIYRWRNRLNVYYRFCRVSPKCSPSNSILRAHFLIWQQQQRKNNVLSISRNKNVQQQQQQQ